MRIVVAYVYPNISNRHYDACAKRFAIQYAKYDPGQRDHDIYVVVNGGGRLSGVQEKFFSPITANFMHHDNSGKDLGAFQRVAERVPCDLLVCMGAPSRPRVNGWLGMIESAVKNYGAGIYGNWGFHVPYPHIRTTAFFICPEILNAYPVLIKTDRQRYHAEHSPESLTMMCKHEGLATNMVTTKGVFGINHWHHCPQDECLLMDQFSDRMAWRDEGAGW